MGGYGWSSNLAKVAIAFFDLVREFKVVTSIIVLGASITLGWLDVPVFNEIVNGLVALATAAIPGIGS